MERVQRNSHLITSYQKLNNKQRNAIREHLDQDQVKFICECCDNLVSGNFAADARLKRKLAPYKNKIRKLSGKGTIKRKKVLLQKGSFFPVLLGSLATSALVGALEKYMQKDG